MRVIGGSARSLHLQCDRVLRIRPTTDMMRETLFNSLGPRVVGAAFCDLYAGCGSVGIEALSRGAAKTVFVERDRRCQNSIQVNLEHTRLSECACVEGGELPSAWSRVARQHGPFDIVFVDPPYGHEPLPDLARRLVIEGEGLAPDGLVVIQHGRDQELADLTEPDREKMFGETRLAIYEVEGDGQGNHE